jgi:hypothetical protein
MDKSPLILPRRPELYSHVQDPHKTTIRDLLRGARLGAIHFVPMPMLIGAGGAVASRVAP